MDLAARVIAWVEQHRDELNDSPLAQGWDGVIELHWNPKTGHLDGLVRTNPLPIARRKKTA